MARRYMHWLRHEDHSDNQWYHGDNRPPSDHRIDTIRRIHPCKCNECLSARNNGQPGPDQSILDLENEWFDREARVFNHSHFMKNGCEFSGATASGTAEAKGQAAQAGVSSAGTGAGCSAVMNVSAEVQCLDLAGFASSEGRYVNT